MYVYNYIVYQSTNSETDVTTGHNCCRFLLFFLEPQVLSRTWRPPPPPLSPKVQWLHKATLLLLQHFHHQHRQAAHQIPERQWRVSDLHFYRRVRNCKAVNVIRWMIADSYRDTVTATNGLSTESIAIGTTQGYTSRLAHYKTENVHTFSEEPLTNRSDERKPGDASQGQDGEILTLRLCHDCHIMLYFRRYRNCVCYRWWS